IPSNEVDIRETTKNTNRTTTPESTNTTRPPTTTPPYTNSQTSKVTPNKGSDASTGTNTYSNVWLGIMMLSLFALGVGFYGWKKKES
ncbi:MAG: LPXTG cell wall anchor domain-containing protein, partial [Allobaculum sp.]|nr:LPXTG cell wall anchor domain-containing protein [Allobaculum sp.]